MESVKRAAQDRPATRGAMPRRQFLKSAAAAGAGLVILPSGALLGADAPGAAEGTLRHASIGVSGMGASDLGEFTRHPDVRIVALCDVDRGRLEQAAKKHPDAKLYQDWRELLKKEGDGIDSVNVTTPDHMHAPIAMTALRMGKHVYCQKPLCHDIHEVRQLTEESARRPRQATQMGIQCHSSIEYRTAVAMVQFGIIGKIQEVHSWSNKAWTGKKGESERRPDRTDPVPEGLAWDLWLGTAPERPFVKDIYHPANWRRWIDFGTGTQGDMACHIVDPVFTALEFTSPEWVLSDRSPPFAETYSPDNKIVHRFPGTKYTTGAIDYYWYDAGARPESGDWPLPEGKLPGQGSMFIGEKGHLLLSHIGGPQPLPREKFADDLKRFKEEVVLPDIPDHYKQFVEAALGRGKTTTPFSYSGPLTETVLMGTVVNRFPKEKLLWDAKACRFTNKPEANAHLRRTYRDGWRVEGLG